MNPERAHILPESISYSQSKELARDADPAVRKALANHPSTKPEVLYYLAEDADPGVRRCVAGNEQTPGQADLILARDDEPDVRLDLVKKIGRLLPDLTPDGHDAVYRAAVSVLEVLCEDQMVRVREMIAEAVQTLPTAPHHVIKRLATDPEPSVSSPVLAVSPVLSDDDLLEIIGSAPVQHALEAIARRDGLNETVSGAIIDTGEQAAITSLLSNQSAQIREDALDLVASQAAGIATWHAPLVRRPALPARVANRIAGFVAQSLLVELGERQDLPEDTVTAIEQTVAQRLNEADDPDEAEPDRVGDKVRAMLDANTLNADTVEAALDEGDNAFVIRAVATLASVDSDVVTKIIANRSPKGMLALAWKAGLSPHLATRLQGSLGGLRSSEILHPTFDGLYPIPEDRLQWQLEFFCSL